MVPKSVAAELPPCPRPPTMERATLKPNQLRPLTVTGAQLSTRTMRLPPSVASGGGGMPRGGAPAWMRRVTRCT
jgi:hypothetical protein